MEFPVITFAPNGYMLSFRTEKSLTITGVDGCRFYKDNMIVDSDGSGYLVRSAEREGWGTPFWGYSLTWKRAIRVKLTFERGGFPVSLAELKERACLAVKRQRYYTSHIADVDGTQARINDATSYREIIEMFF